jgi:subtilisin family serine protease
MIGLFARTAGQERKAIRREGTHLSRKNSFRPALEALEARHLMTSLADVQNYETVFNAAPPAYGGLVIPNDPSFGLQWDLHQNVVPNADLDAREAWGWTTGSTKTTIAVIDTGVDYTHPDLFRNIWINQAEIPGHIRSNLTDVDGDGLFTFWDLNQPINQGQSKANDVNGNGYIDGGDLIAREFNCVPSYKPGQDPNVPDCTYIGGMADGLDNGDNGYIDDLIGWDFKGDDNNPMDGNGHGTHVAGTIGADANNGVGIAGINWKTQMMPVRIPLSGAPTFQEVLENPGKYLDDLRDGQSAAIKAIRYAANNGARVSNNSWGATMTDLAAMLEDLGSDLGLYEGFDDLKDAIQDAGQKGHIVVMAAGNDGMNLDNGIHYPASFETSNMITVASSNTISALAGDSNYGASSVDLAAPGVRICSTVPVSGPAAGDLFDDCATGAPTANSGYARMDGTSMAAPHVTGVIGLVWSLHPSWTHKQVTDQIEGTVEPAAALDGLVRTGGRLNAFRAVTPGPWVATPSLNSFHEIDRPVSTIGIKFNQSINPATFTVEDVTMTRGVLPWQWTSVTVTGVQAVAGTGNREFWISFAGQGPGTYNFFIGPDIKSMTGYQLDVDRDGIGGEASGDVHRFTVKMTMDYLLDESPAADLARLNNFLQTITFVPRDVLIGRVTKTMISQIVVHYNLPMDPLAVSKAANYRLAAPGFDGVLGTRDDSLLAIASAQYDATSRTLTLTPQSPLSQNQLYRLALKSAGLLDRNWRQLDGDGDGTAGGDYVVDFARGNNLRYTDQYNNLVDLALTGPGVMELFLQPTGAAQHLRLLNTAANYSTLSATVNRQYARSPANITLGAISASTAFVNNLPKDIRVGDTEDSTARDLLFASGDLTAKSGWTW